MPKTINIREEQTSSEFDDLRERVWALPFVDRASILACSIVANANKGEAGAAVRGLIDMALDIAKVDSADRRAIYESLMQTAADTLKNLNHRDDIAARLAPCPQ